MSSLTIDEFCRNERISRWKLYEMWKQGRGPRFYLNGPRRRISAEAADDWRRQMEAEAATPEARAAIEQASVKARSVVAKRDIEAA